MNSFPEETSKKTRKRSRKKNKSHNSFRSADEDDNKPKQIKKGCKTCADRIKTVRRTATTDNTISLELPESLTTNQVPLNTERSAFFSDGVLLEALEDCKKLRDAMVLTVLEDSDADLNEELLLKPDKVEKESKLCYKPTKVQKNGEIVTPHEEKLINDYLEGKTMKEEEEMLVLNALHATDKEQSADKRQTLPQKQEFCCVISKANAENQKAVDIESILASNVDCVVSEENMDSLMRKINCFRVTIDNLTLTAAGWKKINQAVDNKTKNCDVVPPPGATYFVECHFVEDSPRSQAQLWKTTPLRFCSRRQIEDVVYFGQSSAHSLRPPHSLASTQNELAAMSCLVCWRHLNQRVPALLGHFSLAGVLQQLYLEMTVNLPVSTDTDGTVAHVRLKLELGKDKVYFGRALLENSSSNFQEDNKSVNIIEEERIIMVKEVPLNVKDLRTISKPKERVTKSYKSDIVSAQQINQTKNTLPNYIDIPVCTNCGKNLVLTNVQSSQDSSVCVSCSNLLGQHQSLMEHNFKISIPRNYATKDHRHHEFLLGIDSVIGFPLFAGIQEELSCYIDYKFPEITSGLKAELAKSETTSRVVNCEPQPSFSSVHRHTLPLPVVLPLSPLLAACSPGVTLRLWLRYYKPTPRDHMVAMALLPMDELCLMELEFDKKKQKAAVIKVLELPLALVPSSVTAPYQQYHNLGVLRVSVTYSNYVSTAPSSKEYHQDKQVTDKEITNEDFKEEIKISETNLSVQGRNLHTLPSSKCSESEAPKLFAQSGDVQHISVLLDKISSQKDKINENNLKAEKTRFWTGPFGKREYDTQREYDAHTNMQSVNSKVVHNQRLCTEPKLISSQNKCVENNVTSVDPLRDIFGDGDHRNTSLPEPSRPVMKEDFDILAESLEQRFNQLQSDLMKERQRGLSEINNMVMDKRKLNSLINDDVNDDFLSFQSLSSNSSMESLPFILGPPADFKDVQKTVACSKVNETCSDTQSDKTVSNTISGFLKEEVDVLNLGSNESFDKENTKPEASKPKTFKAKIKVDRAVNLKAVKAPSNGKKGKVPPSSWVSFGTGDCCEQNCGTGGLVCSGRRFTTPVIRRNHNPIWNLAWDIDLPVEYLQQVNKRLVFRVFEENLDGALGFASANLSILTSGLPCLSSWLSINDLAGACKGQLKIVITPLEDVSQYQECSVFDIEEDEFDEVKENKPEAATSYQNNRRKSASFIASESEIFLNDNEGATSKDVDKEEQPMKEPDSLEGLEGEDPFSADDVISDYKNTLENNFRNEMAGLENLIKFLRVGSMSNELSFLRATENKENLSSNRTSQNPSTESRTNPLPEIGKSSISRTDSGNNQLSKQNLHRDRILIDASTETIDKEGIHSSYNQVSSEDILSKLLHQISMFQPPAIKITDNTCQTITPETKEMFTETSIENQSKPEISRTVHMSDASTETDDICNNRSALTADDNCTSHSPHVCGELGSVLLQHFLTCKPAAVKVTDSACQTASQDKVSTADSSGVFTSGISTDVPGDNYSGGTVLPIYQKKWISAEENQTNDERLIAIDNNIKDLERYLKENLIMDDEDDIPFVNSKEGSYCESLNDIDSLHPSVKESNHSSSDLESLESYSQIIIFPRETPDGGNPSTVPDTQNLCNTDNTGTTLKRQGTFVIEKQEDNTKEPTLEKENEGE